MCHAICVNSSSLIAWLFPVIWGRVEEAENGELPTHLPKPTSAYWDLLAWLVFYSSYSQIRFPSVNTRINQLISHLL